MAWNAFQKQLCSTAQGKDWYNTGLALSYWKRHLDPRSQTADLAKPRPSRWLQDKQAQAVAMGAQLVLLVEAKWLAQWNLEEVKYQAVSYVCSLTHS